jgi:hypothetical protein
MVPTVPQVVGAVLGMQEMAVMAQVLGRVLGLLEVLEETAGVVAAEALGSPLWEDTGETAVFLFIGKKEKDI